jgi:hypothetical protein
MEQPGIARCYDYTDYLVVNGTYRFSPSFINGLLISPNLPEERTCITYPALLPAMRLGRIAEGQRLIVV